MSKKQRKARDELHPKKAFIKGYPREHYNVDHSEKKQYKTEESARKVARIMMEKRGSEGLSVYICPFCGCWHIGHEVPFEIDYRARRLRMTLNNELIMINRYRADLNHVATEVLAINEKLDKLKYLINQHYQELKEFYPNDQRSYSEDDRSVSDDVRPEENE